MLGVATPDSSARIDATVMARSGAYSALGISMKSFCPSRSRYSSYAHGRTGSLSSSTEAPVYKQTCRKEKNVLTRRTTVPKGNLHNYLKTDLQTQRSPAQFFFKKRGNKPTKANVVRMLWGRKGESGKKRKRCQFRRGGIAAALYFGAFLYRPPTWVVHPGDLLRLSLSLSR